MYCDLIARAVIDGISQSHIASGVDVGAEVEPDVAVPADA
jgi:small subunit ribosomal protein S2